jgi:type VI secretion system protein ImpG
MLPYYERELGYLRRNLREFAERYPKIAGSLLISGEVCEDPHIERMIESFALLNARIAKRLDDDYPEFTEALFEVLYPHYLRPFPSCSIAHLDSGATPSSRPRPARSRAAPSSHAPVRGAPALPHRVSGDGGAAGTDRGRLPRSSARPTRVRLPDGATASISLTIAATADQITPAKAGLPRLRVFIDGEPSFCAALRDALFMRTVAAYAEAGGSGRWTRLDAIPIRAAGFDENDALIDFPARPRRLPPADRILLLPRKIQLLRHRPGGADGALPAPGAARSRCTWRWPASAGLEHGAHARHLSTNNVLLGCTPVVNLFRQRGEPIRLTHTTASYPVLADARRAFAYEVQSIDSVNLVRQTPQGESVVEFRPFYSLSTPRRPNRTAITGSCGATRRWPSAAPASKPRSPSSISTSIRPRSKPTP